MKNIILRTNVLASLLYLGISFQADAQTTSQSVKKTTSIVNSDGSKTSIVVNETTKTTVNADGTITSVVTRDTVKVGADEKFSNTMNKVFNDGDNTEKKYPRLYGGLTFSRIDWGFSRMMDNGSFTLSDENRFLAREKSSNFGFDVAQFGVRFNDNFKTYISAGFEWNYLRLKENVKFIENTSTLTYDIIDRSEIDYTKNVFTSTYMRLPITFEWRSNRNRHGERVKVAFGAMTGVLLKGTQRLKSDENGKQKFKDNFNLASFQYGPFVRIGYDDFGLFAKYYVNDFFEHSPNQKGLNNLAFGLTLGF